MTRSTWVLEAFLTLLYSGLILPPDHVPPYFTHASRLLLRRAGDGTVRKGLNDLAVPWAYAHRDHKITSII